MSPHVLRVSQLKRQQNIALLIAPKKTPRIVFMKEKTKRKCFHSCRIHKDCF